MDRRLSPRYFNNGAALVASRAMTVMGTPLGAGDTIDPNLPAGTRLRLWMSGRAVPKDMYRPTPQAEPAEASDDTWMEASDGWSVVQHGGGWFHLVPEGVDEAATPDAESIIRVQGTEDAQGAAEQRRQLHRNKGADMQATGGGYYTITAPWLTEPVKVRGKDAADAKLAEVVASAPATEEPPTPVAEPFNEGDTVLVQHPGSPLHGQNATVVTLAGDEAQVQAVDAAEDAEPETLPLSSLAAPLPAEPAAEGAAQADDAAEGSATVQGATDDEAAAAEAEAETDTGGGAEAATDDAAADEAEDDATEE